jgi:hypothetical protein
MELLNKIQQGLKAPKGQMNKFGGYKYRSCEDILEAVKPLLCGATLIITDEIVCLHDEGVVVIENKDEKNNTSVTMTMPASRFYVKATATLKNGEEEISVSAFARESVIKKGMDESQITGAASSYARKYALNGLFCIDDTKDSDATNTGEDTTQKPKNLFKPTQSTVPNKKQQVVLDLVFTDIAKKYHVNKEKMTKEIFDFKKKYPDSGTPANIKKIVVWLEKYKLKEIVDGPDEFDDKLLMKDTVHVCKNASCDHCDQELLYQDLVESPAGMVCPHCGEIPQEK